MSRWPFFACLVLSMSVISCQAFGQANVNENLETNFIFVDGTSGSDSNPGTPQSPLQTIGAAITMALKANESSVGSRIFVNPGIYRESLTILETSRNTTLPITIQATQTGTVYISGAVQYTNWSPYSGNKAIYVNAWPNTWGLCSGPGGGRWQNPGPPQPDIVLRQEMFFVNGSQLTQVLSQNEMQQGTFYVDETNALAYIWPLAGTNIATADVEAATLPSLLNVEGSASNLVFRGLTFEYANSCRENFAVNVQGGANNILFANDNFLWNNGTGLYIDAGVQYFTVRNAVSNHNGQNGYGAGETLYGEYVNITANYNNWRGAQGAYYAWDSSGAHFFAVHSDIVTGIVSAYNQTHGVHWDTDIANLQATGVISNGNLLNGIFFEVVEGPNSVSNSYVCNNNLGTHDGSGPAGGLDLRNAENITLTSSRLYNNGTGQISVQGVAGGITTYNWQTGQYFTAITENFVNTHNILQSVGSGQQVFHDNILGGTDWTDFQTTLSSNNNLWWNSTNSSAFTVPVPYLGTTDTYSGWQTVTAQDLSSHWFAPLPTAFDACDIPVDIPDYWMIADSGSHTLANNTATFTVNFSALGTFAGTATLTFDGVSEVPGLSANLSSSTATIPGGSAALTVTSSGAAAGSYPITIIATSGGITHTVTAWLVIL
ncbi:MAG TPA: hypothetical protein VEF05_15510 [Terriglobales bacterium]|nr:hypothetical protein [Terriglobales bacterium]